MLTRQIDTLGAELAQLNSSYAEGNIHATRYREESGRLEKQIESYRRSLGNIGITTRQLAQSASAAQFGLNNMGMRMLMIGQFADDMQYGLRGIVNNVPQLAMAFGGGPGVAGALSVAAVVANQFFSRMQVGVDTTMPKIVQLQQQLENVEKATGGRPTIVQMQQRESIEKQIEEQTKGADAFKELGKPIIEPDAAERGKRVMDVFRSGGVAAEARNALAELSAGRMEQQDKVAQGLLFQARTGLGDNPNLQKSLAERRGELLRRAQAYQGGQFAKAESGDEAAIARLVSDLKDVGYIAAAKAIEDEARKPAESERAGETSSDAFAERVAAQRKLQTDFAKARNDQIIEDERQKKEFAERQKDFAEQRQARRAEGVAGMVQAVGGGDMAQNMMMQLANNPEFRRKFGARTRSEAITEAAETTRAELTRQAMLPEGMGGLGLNQKAAAEFANQAVSQAMIPAMDAAEQQGRDLPMTQRELANAMKENNRMQREIIAQNRRGIEVRWSSR